MLKEKIVNLEKLQQKLPKLLNMKFVNKELVDVYEPPYSFIRNGCLYISGENGDCACDYYGEFRGNDPYINPKLVEFAAKNGGYFEWENPACIVFCKN
jgi:hypothetical protein